MPPAPELIRTLPEFEELLDHLCHEPLVGIDTEAASFHRFRDRVYLLQLSSATRTAVVDPLALGGLPGFERLLGSPETELIFHDGDYDLRLLHHEFGFRVHHLFDTRIAAQLCNEPSIGLASLLQKYFGVATDKRFQRADWSRRPLSPEMIDYAATDTRHLPDLRAALSDTLQALGRSSWLTEECEILTMVEWSPPEPPRTAALRMKGARALDRRALAVLQEVFAWRHEHALRLDRALFRILPNEALIQIATTQPRSTDELRRMRGVNRELASSHGNELVAAVDRGLSVPDDELPRFAKARRPKPDPAFDLRLERLRALRTQLALAFDLAPGVLCPNATLEQVARSEATSLAALQTVPGVRRWQVAAFGGEMLAAIRAG